MRRIVLSLAFAFAFAVAAGAAQAQTTAKPFLLAASPQLEDPYSRTALIVIPAGDKHIGLSS